MAVFGRSFPIRGVTINRGIRIISAVQTLQSSLYTDTDTFFTPTVHRGYTLVADAGTYTITGADGVRDVTVAVTAGSYSLTGGTTNLNPQLLAGLVASDDVFQTPTVLHGPVSALPSLVTDTDTFFVPTVSRGSVSLLPLRVIDTDSFYAPELILDGAPHPGLVTSDDTFYVPIILPGPVSALPGLVTDSDVIYAPTTLSHYPLLPSLVIDTDTFYAPTQTNSKTLLSSLFVDDDVIYSTTVLHPNLVSPPLLTDVDVIYTLTVANGATLFPTLATDADTFYQATLQGGSVTIHPPLVVDQDIFLVPLVGLQKKGGGNGGGGGGGTVPSDLKYASQFTLTESGLIYALEVESSTAKVINTRMVLYADNGSNLPGALLGQSAVKSSVVIGANTYPLLVAVSRLAGQKVWIALHSDGNFNWFLVSSPNGAKYNTDLFSDGPSDPFGPTSNDNKKAPVFVLYLSAANAGITAGLVTDADTFFTPAISGSKALLPSLLVDTDFFYAPSTLSVDVVLPSLVLSDDVEYAPSVSGSLTLFPGLVLSDNLIQPTNLGRSDYFVNSANVPSDDIIYVPAVSQSGANSSISYYVDLDVFYSPFVAAFAPTIFSASMPSDDVIYHPAVTTSGSSISPDLYADNDVIYPSFVGRGAGFVFGADFPSDDVVWQATVTSFGAGLPPALYTDVDVFFAPVVVDVYQLTTGAVTDADAFYVPTISAGGATLAPDFVVLAGEDFWPPTITQQLGTVVLHPSLFNDTDQFYSATRVGHKSGRRQVFLSGRNDADRLLVADLEPTE